MDEAALYPPIDPATFDLIVVGTGLPESILAAAASAAGKTVLHLDPNPFYGSHFSSLPLDELTSFLQSHSLYSAVEISSHSPSTLNPCKFNLDLAGPRVLFCSDSIVDLMLRSGASQYIEFKSIDVSFICSEEGKLSSVPDSRSAIFRDSSLALSEKTRLGNFFKLVEAHLRANGIDGDDEDVSERKRIPEEDLERPFVEFLNKMRLSAKIKSIIVYAIAMVDYDQDDMNLCEHVLKTKDGIERLALYHSSVGRFSNALGAMIYPIYGQGELPQAFCRRAAVKGCLYVLRMPVTELLMDEENGSYRGVKVTSGQELFSQQVVLSPSFIVSKFVRPSQGVIRARIEDLGKGDVCGKVARGICITKSSLKQDVINLLVVYPPKSLHPEQVTSVRVLQIGSNLAVCPAGMFVMYISSLCDDAALGKKSLHSAVNSIFSIPVSEAAEDSSSNESENTEVKPTLLWSAMYIQETIMGSFDTVSITPTPDGNLNYNDIIATTKEHFFKMFPDDEFFPEASFVDPEDDAVLDQSHEDDSLSSK